MTKAKMFKWLTCVAVLTLLAGLVGCAGPGTVPGTASDTGTLRVLIDNRVAVKSLLPPISMVCSSYEVRVRNSAGTAVATENIKGDRTFPNLVPADSPFSVYVQGLNSDSMVIGDGQTDDIMVTADMIVDCPIAVVELIGDGHLDVRVDWTAYPAAVITPVVESQWSYGGNGYTDISADWDLTTPHVASLLKTPLARGWYVLIWRLFEEGSAIASAGFATLCRVVSNQTTADTILIVPSTSTGFRLLIDLDFYDEIELIPNIKEGLLEYSNDEPQTISVEDAGAMVFQWFLNGADGNTSNSYTVEPATLLPGISYTLNVIAFSADDGGKHAGMLTWTLNKQ